MRHPLVLMAILAVALIALGSGIYYAVATASPQSQTSTPVMGTIEETVSGQGTVEPAQNPDLAFQNGGKLASVNVAVGQKVSQGQLLASLDVSALSAQRAQAQANLKAQQARLSQLQAGPRGVDVSAKQTAIDQAHATLSSLYSGIPAALVGAYDKSFSGVIASTDTLFNQPNSASPSLAFTTTNSQIGVNASNGRSLINAELSLWKQETDSLSSASQPSQIDQELTMSLGHLNSLRTYLDTLLQALGSATPSQSFSQATIASAQASVGALRDTTNSMIATLLTVQQQIQTDRLLIRSAEDALNQTNAGSTAQDIQAQQAQVEAAQASIENINAQIANNVIVAPYSGIITSVAVKSGQIVPPNTVAISLAPESALQVVIYLSEVGVAKLAVGNPASVTLDAYGLARTFAAHVVSIDRSPTQQNGTPGYKVTLQFATDDTAISSGMTANVTITAATKQQALIIPKSAVLQNGSSSFVLVQNGKNVLQKQVQLGLIGSTTVEVTSGLTANDQFLTTTK